VRFVLFRYYPPNRTTTVEENPCRDNFTISVAGQVPANVDLSNDDHARSILENGKEYALIRCPKGNAYIKVYLYQAPFNPQNWGNEWVVHGNYPSVFKFSLYKPEYKNRARDERLKDERTTKANEERLYIQNLKQSIVWRGSTFLGILERIPVYQASFIKNYTGCFNVEGKLSVMVTPFRTPTMAFCQPPGTNIHFAVREGNHEPEIGVSTTYESQAAEMWFRASKFREYGQLSFKEVRRETTISREMHAIIDGLGLMLGLLLVGSILLMCAVASSSGGCSSPNGDVSMAGGGGNSEAASDNEVQPGPASDAIGKITHSSSTNALIDVTTHKFTDGKHTGYGYTTDEAEKAFEIARKNNLDNYTIRGKGII
jgi:hypothetical protein